MQLRFVKIVIIALAFMQAASTAHAMNGMVYWGMAQTFLHWFRLNEKEIIPLQFPEKNENNFYCVHAQKCFRSKQLDGNVLEDYIKNHDIKVIISLRACRPTEPWYIGEKALCQKLGVVLYDFGFDPFILPTKEKLKELFDIFDLHSNERVLLHCYAGADRTGLIAALYAAEKMNASLEEALFQQHPFFGHDEKAFPHMKKFTYWWYEMKKKLGGNRNAILDAYDPQEFMRGVEMPVRTKTVVSKRV